MSTRAEVIAALRKYVDETPVAIEDGRLIHDVNGKPIVIYVAEAINAITLLIGDNKAHWGYSPR